MDFYSISERMSGRPTIKDIAEECNVSLSTVSLVLNNNPRISDKTRQKVMEAVKARGYQPNNQARGLASKSSHILSVVVPHINSVFSDVYFGQIINGIYDAVTDLQYKIMLEVANLKYIRSYEFMNTLKGRRADGMLFIGSSLFDRYLTEFEHESYPFVLLNHYFPDADLNTVCADYRDAGRQAAEYLLDLGHRSVGMISGTNIQTQADLREVFSRTIANAGISSAVPWSDGRFSQEEGYLAARDLLQQYPGLTALFCGNDKMAFGALQCAKDLDRSVPDDLSIMGMDDIPSTRLTSPQLTSIQAPLQEIGRRGAQAVVEVFKGEMRSVREFLPVRLIERGSTGPVCTRF